MITDMTNASSWEKDMPSKSLDSKVVSSMEPGSIIEIHGYCLAYCLCPLLSLHLRLSPNDDIKCTCCLSLISLIFWSLVPILIIPWELFITDLRAQNLLLMRASIFASKWSSPQSCARGLDENHSTYFYQGCQVELATSKSIWVL